LAHFLKIDIDPMRYLSLGRDAENLQHGHSSGLDLQLAMSGGCLRFEEGRIAKRDIPNFKMKIAQTGAPLAMTGECVSMVAKKFKQSSIWSEFAGVTNQLDKALQKVNYEEVQTCIRENHRLLVDIGVVPPRVQEFIQKLEKEGAAAKICGAGSIAGEKGGVVLIVSEQDTSSIARQFGYPLQQFQGDCYGTHLI
jgi:mevalonate kinase